MDLAGLDADLTDEFAGGGFGHCSPSRVADKETLRGRGGQRSCGSLSGPASSLQGTPHWREGRNGCSVAGLGSALGESEHGACGGCHPVRHGRGAGAGCRADECGRPGNDHRHRRAGQAQPARDQSSVSVATQADIEASRPTGLSKCSRSSPTSSSATAARVRRSAGSTPPARSRGCPRSSAATARGRR